MQLHRKSKGSGFGKFLLLVVLALIIGGGAYIAVVFFEKEQPSITLGGSTEYLGKDATFNLSASDAKSGLRTLSFTIQQGDKKVEIINVAFPRRGYSGKIGPASYMKDINFKLDNSGLTDGEAELILRVSDYSLRGLLAGNINEFRKKVTIDTQAPKIRLLHAERYISPGGSGIVIYQLQGSAIKHGAEFAGHLHPGHPIGDGRDDVFIAYIALPYDTKTIGKSELLAEDAAGNRSNLAFSPIFKKVAQRKDKINVGDNFLSAKIPEFEQYYPQMQGSMVEKYLYTNREVRKANNQKIFDLCQSPISQRLWKDRFTRMPGASKAGYADHRTYYYQGKEIDRQVHLGMDIASTQRAEVKAANRGKVVFADYLGIYGNMVLLDHGQGVFSLYSHLSAIQVAIGDEIDTDVVLGLTGTSGMAGGDHLHFSVLINGIFVTPKEWWDQQWINVTIDDPIADSRF